MVVGIGYRKTTTKWCSSCALPEAAAATRIYEIAIFRPPRCTASEQFVSQRTEVKIIQSSPLSLFLSFPGVFPRVAMRNRLL